MPDPDLEYGSHLVHGILFKLGPVKVDAPLSESDLEGWERRRGIELPPWQAELLVSLSRAYLGEMHTASSASAISPWPKARNMWKYVCDEMHKRKPPKKEKPDGGSQRRRNPTSG